MISTSLVVSVGIDVGKAKLDVACVRADKSHVHQVFKNSEAGIREMQRFLQMQRTATTVPCVLESTGDCHLLASLMLVEAGVAVKCINPLITKKHIKSSIRGAKSDKLDAVMLANIGLIEANLPDFADTREIIRARKLVSTVGHLETTRQQYAAHFKCLEETSAKLGLKCDTRAAKKILAALEAQIEAYRIKIVEAAPPEATQISDMLPGVSEQQAAVILVAIGDKKFGNRDQLVAFTGLDVRIQESGKWIGKGRLSKRGNSFLRKVLFQVGWGLYMHHPEYNKKYLEMRAAGKNHKTAIIALARKFLRFLFAFYWKKAIQHRAPVAALPRRTKMHLSPITMLPSIATVQ